MGHAASWSAARIWRAFQLGWRDQSSAASAPACGAAAEVPAKGRPRQRLGKGTVATKSGFTAPYFEPHELYATRRPDASTAPTATTSEPSPGKGMLPAEEV